MKRQHKEKKADELLPYREKIAAATGLESIRLLSCDRCNLTEECEALQIAGKEVRCELSDDDADIDPVPKYHTDCWLNELHENIRHPKDFTIGHDNLDAILKKERRPSVFRGRRRGRSIVLPGSMFTE